jgi:TRAP-type C4-dicarboxylate transport system permease small subunit
VGAGGGGILERVSAWLALAGGLVVLGLALLVSASVVLRWLTARGVPGDFELVQAGLAVAVFAFLPLAQLRGANIMVDSFTARAPAALRRGLDALWAQVYAGAAGLLAWRTWEGTRDAFAAGTGSMVLALPLGWAMAPAVLLLGWLAVATLAGALRRRTNRG